MATLIASPSVGVASTTSTRSAGPTLVQGPSQVSTVATFQYPAWAIIPAFGDVEIYVDTQDTLLSDDEP